MEPAAGGPGAAGHGALAHQSDPAPTCSAVRDLEVSGRSHHRSHRSVVGAGIQEAVPRDTVLIVDGTLVPTRDHKIAEQSKNYRYSTNHRVVIDASTRLIVVVGQALPGNRNNCRAWTESGAEAAVGTTTAIADGGYRGTGLVIPHRRHAKNEELPAWKQTHNKSHKQVRARVEHVFARMKTWKILRDCRLKGDGVHHAVLGIAHLHNLALTG